MSVLAILRVENNNIENIQVETLFLSVFHLILGERESVARKKLPQEKRTIKYVPHVITVKK
jgi:hypothetical protein